MNIKQKSVVLTLVVLISAIGLACQATAVGSFLATATLIPSLTPTFIPTPAPTNTSVASPTTLPSSTPLPSGTVKEDLPDGSLLFNDYDYKYSITIPADWFVLTLEKEDLDAILKKGGESNPQLKQSLELFQSTMTAETFRMMAMYAANYAETQGTNINIAILPESGFLSLPLDYLTEMLADNLKQTLNANVDTYKTDFNANGIEYGKIEFTQNVTNEFGVKVQLYQQLFIFKNASNNFLTLTFTTPLDQKNNLIPMFEGMLNSLTFIE